MAIPQSFLQELLARTDVVELVGRHVPLKKAGANFMGLCPFHGEKSPSFSVSPSKQFYHCFGCGKNGNAIGFLIEHAGMSFPEAVKDLAGQLGIHVPDDDASPDDRAKAAEQRQKQATLSEVLEKAGQSWRKHLRNSQRAIDYLKSRGLSGEIARQFGLGYAPDGWRSLASVFPRYDDSLLVESGLVIVSAGEEGKSIGDDAPQDAIAPMPETGRQPEKRYDRFRDRIMFPIRSVKGECIGFGGRVLGDAKPKYLNSPETPIFSKGRELYGLFEARNALRETGYVLVTEGYMDVVALAQLGFPNVVATLGTACTSDHVQKLFRFTESVVFSFDGDAAGRRAARKALDGALPYATDVRSVKFLFLPAEHDPDSYIRQFGRDAFARLVSDAVPLSRFLIEAAREGCDLATAEGRAHMASNARPLWLALPAGLLKQQVLNEIAGLGQLEPDDLARSWGAGTDRRAASVAASRLRQVASRTARRSGVRPPIEASARNIAQLLLRDTGNWDALTMEDHGILCRLDGQFGDLFRWIDSQVHEHGAQPLATLAASLTGQPFEALARDVISLDNLQPLGRSVQDPTTPPSALRMAVLRLRIDVIDEELRRVNGLPATDPSKAALQQSLILQQYALKKQQTLEKAA